MVGLSIAHQINKSRPELSILIIDKEIHLVNMVQEEIVSFACGNLL